MKLLLEPITTMADPSSATTIISSSSFWSRLSVDIQHSIFSLLPVSSLIRCTVVSKAWRSLIQSDSFTTSYSSKGDDDVHFVLFRGGSDNPSVAYSYNPFLNRWFSALRFNFPLESHTVVASVSSSFLLVDSTSDNRTRLESHNFMVVNPFNGSTACTPPGIPYSLFSDVLGPDVSTCENKKSVFRWFLSGRGRRQILDGPLFWFSKRSAMLLMFDGNKLGCLPVCSPPLFLSSPRSTYYVNLVVIDGGLFLVGGLGENGMIAKVGIWELDRGSKKVGWTESTELKWRLVCYMPDEFFDKFSVPKLTEFRIVNWKGKICFHNVRASIILMFDLSTQMWWWPPPPPQPLLSFLASRPDDYWPPPPPEPLVSFLASRPDDYWIGYAVEPRIDLVKQVAGRPDASTTAGISSAAGHA